MLAGGRWTLKVDEVSSGPVWTYRDCPVLSAANRHQASAFRREETPCRLPVSIKIFVPRGWGLCVFRRMVSGPSVCGHCPGRLATLWSHTHTHLTFAGRVYVRLCPHTHTRVRPPRIAGNHEKATLCSQTAQSDHSGAPLTPMQRLLPTEPVYVCMWVYPSVRLH